MTVKDVRRGWELLFKRRINLSINKLLLRLPQLWEHPITPNPLDQTYSHAIEKRDSEKLLTTLLIIALLSCLVLFANFAGGYINDLFKIPNKNQEKIEKVLKNPDLVKTIPFLIIVVIGAPLLEDFVYRFSLMNMNSRSRLSL